MDPRRPSVHRHRRPAVVTALLALVALAALAGCSDGSAGDEDFPDLTAGTRVYDQTGDSLSAAETDGLQQRLDALQDDTGADVIAVVRELDADPEDTLDQVEALQQAWVGAAGVDQDTAGAILVNREPGTDDEARAGIFLGTTYDDGNVPRGEQEAIVEDELVPPLRDGDVAGSLTAGIERLDSSIRNGPPTNALNDFAEGPGSSWLPWVGLALALLGGGAAAWLFGRRARPTVPEQPATTARPDRDTDPAVASALVHGGVQASAVPAAVLALAARDAIDIEQEKEPSWGTKGTVQVRLRDESRVHGEVEQAVWGMLDDRAEGGVVDSGGLKKTAHGPGATKQVVRDRLEASGWLAPDSARPRAGLVGLALLGGLLMIGGIVVAAGGAVPMLLTIFPAGALLLGAILAAVVYSPLSVAGRDAARPWEAYRDGLKAAGKDDAASLDLDAVLPDIVALGLVPTFRKRLDAATDPESGTTLRAFTASAGSPYAGDRAVFGWGAFAGVYASSGSAGSTASGGGAGGGGGAAGGT